MCWELVCTSPLSGQPPSLLPLPSLDLLPQSQVCHTWSFPDEVASWAEDIRAPCLAPAVSRKIATGWPLQLLSTSCPQPPIPSHLSPACSPHLPNTRQTRRSRQPRARLLVPCPSPGLHLSIPTSSVQQRPGPSFWGVQGTPPTMHTGFQVRQFSPPSTDHDVDDCGTWPSQGPSLQWVSG